MNFGVQLVNSDDTLSAPVNLKDYVQLFTTGGHIIMDSVRIPLADFANVTLTKVRGVRFVFNDTAQSTVLLSSLRLSRSEAASTNANVGHIIGSDAPGGAPQETITVATGNQAPVLRTSATNEVEVDLVSAVAFPVTDELARLRVGGRDVVQSRFADDGDTHHIIFKMTPSEFAALPNGAAMKVRYGEEAANREWDFGKLQKANLQ
jgi:hypothetical protein